MEHLLKALEEREVILFIQGPEELERFRDIISNNSYNPLLGYSESLANCDSWDGAIGYVGYDETNEMFYLEKENFDNLTVIKLM